jgi:hypothetical protein
MCDLPSRGVAAGCWVQQWVDASVQCRHYSISAGMYNSIVCCLSACLLRSYSWIVYKFLLPFHVRAIHAAYKVHVLQTELG